VAIKNGTIYVPSFDPTGNAGEYTVTSAILNSLTCPNGVYDIAAGWVIWPAAIDVNTGDMLTGVTHRYKILSVKPSDFSVCDLTVVWDEVGPEVDAPANGTTIVISETSPNYKFGFPVSELIYPDVFNGASEAAYNADILNIADNISGRASEVVRTFVNTDWAVPPGGVDLAIDIFHGLGTTDLILKVYEEVGPTEFVETVVDIKPISNSVVRLVIADTAAFSGKVVIHLIPLLTKI
jgi:hypothetical protein